jgi:hypothetical protein
MPLSMPNALTWTKWSSSAGHRRSWRRSGAEFGFATTTDLDALINDGSVDLVDICLPTRLHADVAVRAMQAGQDVLIELPLAATLDDAQRIVAAQRATGRRAFVDMFSRFTPPTTSYANRWPTSATPGRVVLADRGLTSFALWRRASATGADLLWRVKNSSIGLRPHPSQDLADGSWLARIDPPKAQRGTVEPMIVRVVDYTIDDGRDSDTAYRLFTTITDPNRPRRRTWPWHTPSAGKSRTS